MSEKLLSFLYKAEMSQRLDKFLAAELPEFSRSRLQALIKDGQVTINGVPAHKAGQMLESGAQVVLQVPPVQPSELVAEDIALEIVYENDDLMVVNKPAGMVVHPAAGHASGTLVHAALAHAPEMEGIGGEQRPGVVHRLDKNTSGLILMAKNDAAHHWLQDQFRTRNVKKVYLTLVDGAPPTPTGRVETPIGRSTSQRKMMAVVPAGKGRDSVTEYRTLETFRSHTLIEVHPITGRMHQIRIHMEFLGCPVVGDTIYGLRRPSLPLDRHFLHAARLTITLPGETSPRTFTAPLPEELEGILATLRHSS